MAAPSTYGSYELVEDTMHYEHKYSTGFLNGFYRTYKRRPVYVKTWEAILKDTETGRPDSQNPGNLSNSDNWYLDYVDYSKSWHQGLTRVVRESWIKRGDWETISTEAL